MGVKIEAHHRCSRLQPALVVNDYVMVRDALVEETKPSARAVNYVVSERRRCRQYEVAAGPQRGMTLLEQVTLVQYVLNQGHEQDDVEFLPEAERLPVDVVAQELATRVALSGTNQRTFVDIRSNIAPEVWNRSLECRRIVATDLEHVAADVR